MEWYTRGSLNFVLVIHTTNETERPKDPSTVSIEGVVHKIHDNVLADHRGKMCEIAYSMYISIDRVFHIMHETLFMKKLSVRWVPCLLTAEQKLSRVTTSYVLLKLNPTEFLNS